MDMHDYQQVLNHIQEEELVKFTTDMLKINSVFDPDKEGYNEERVAHFIADKLKAIGLQVFVEEVEPGRPNVIGILQGSGPGKTLLFEGHTDVVTAGDEGEWSYPPFAARIDSGRIYGRGACDTKGNVAAAIHAVRAIKESGVDFPGRILLCMPVDEEGLMIGIKHFIQNGWADNVDAAIICEPEENNVCVAQKGAIRMGIKIKGKMAHGAMPQSGVNPNWRMAKVICELEKLQQKEIDRLGKHKYLGYPSITPTIIRAPRKGEPQINVIPSECYTTLDIRTVPGQDHGGLIQEIQDILDILAKEDSDFRGSLEVMERRPWTETPKEEPVVRAVCVAYRLVTGKEPVYNGVPGATDGTFLNCLKDIPIVTTGAGGRSVPHQADEYVEIAELVETTKLYALSAMLYLNGDI